MYFKILRQEQTVPAARGTCGRHFPAGIYGVKYAVEMRIDNFENCYRRALHGHPERTLRRLKNTMLPEDHYAAFAEKYTATFAEDRSAAENRSTLKFAERILFVKRFHV